MFYFYKSDGSLNRCLLHFLAFLFFLVFVFFFFSLLRQFCDGEYRAKAAAIIHKDALTWREIKTNVMDHIKVENVE